MNGSSLSEISFGTSGLRGHSAAFTNKNIFAYICAFLEIVGGSSEKIIYVGADLRSSSPNIAANVIAIIKAMGWQAIYGGNVPTPALAAYAMEHNCPAIVITGSHVPKNYNGIKFYRRDGEILKQDEVQIRKKSATLLTKAQEFPPATLPETELAIVRSYINRFISIFPKNTLNGLKIGIDQHSAVGRDILLDIMQQLGADCFAYNRCKEFVAIDTEALSSEIMSQAKEQIDRHNLDAIISSDGDGDRPLVIDENGLQVNGDVLGALCAKALGINIVVTPLSSTSAIELSGWFDKIVRTKIGSPFVIEAMIKEQVVGANIAGFEANGGFLLGSDLTLRNGVISKLPTRDAILPIVSVLKLLVDKNISLSELVKFLPDRFMKADRIKAVPSDKALEFLNAVKTSKDVRNAISTHLINLKAIDNTDGIRMYFDDKIIVHFRQSGNAPEMRIYVETDKSDLTEKMLDEITKSLKDYLRKKGILDEQG